jgi:hypothetical protein
MRHILLPWKERGYSSYGRWPHINGDKYVAWVSGVNYSNIKYIGCERWHYNWSIILDDGSIKWNDNAPTYYEQYANTADEARIITDEKLIKAGFRLLNSNDKLLALL